MSQARLYQRLRHESHGWSRLQAEGQAPRVAGSSCYLVEAYDESRPPTPFLYIGYSNSPLRRLSEHMGLLTGGAKETRGYGTRLFQVCTVTNFPALRGAKTLRERHKWFGLLFEALWQGARRVTALVQNHLRSQLPGVPSCAEALDRVEREALRHGNVELTCFVRLAALCRHPAFAPGGLHVVFLTDHHLGVFRQAQRILNDFHFAWIEREAWLRPRPGVDGEANVTQAEPHVFRYRDLYRPVAGAQL